MSETTQLMLESAERLLRDACPKAVVDQVEAGLRPDGLWAELEALGLLNACVPEAQGGVGLSLAEGLTLLRLAGRYAVPAPFAETLLGRALVAEAGLPETLEGMMTIAAPAVQGDGYAPRALCALGPLGAVGPEGAERFCELPVSPPERLAPLASPARASRGSPSPSCLAAHPRRRASPPPWRRAWPSSRVCWR